MAYFAISPGISNSTDNNVESMANRSELGSPSTRYVQVTMVLIHIAYLNFIYSPMMAETQSCDFVTGSEDDSGLDMSGTR